MQIRQYYYRLGKLHFDWPCVCSQNRRITVRLESGTNLNPPFATNHQARWSLPQLSTALFFICPAAIANPMGGSRRGQFFTTAANPTPQSGRDADHQTKIRHIMGHHRARPNHRPPSNGQPRQDDAVGAKRGAFLQQGLGISFQMNPAPRPQVIGKNSVRTNEDIILDHQAIP